MPSKHSDKSSSTQVVGSEKAKNVSHVPCKFFRQSICQAGDKCPFSHDLSNDTQMVCKYFQRGNCKFGSKCALLHITPDGKQVNKKSIVSTAGSTTPGGAKSTKKKEKGGLRSPEGAKGLSHELSQDNKELPSLGTSSSSAINSSINASPGRPKPIPKPFKEAGTIDENAGSEQALVDLAAQILSKYNGVKPQDAETTTTTTAMYEAPPPSLTLDTHTTQFAQTQPSLPLGGSFSTGTGSAGLGSTAGAPVSAPIYAATPQHQVRSFSATLPFQPSPSLWNTSKLTSVQGDEFAIADDEDDEDDSNLVAGGLRRISQPRSFAEFGSLLHRNLSTGEQSYKEQADEEEEEGYTEQLVPSALQDLLTPKERERRNSRNSQQKSGRVFSSPSQSSPINMGVRRSSSSSEPNGDLWGPRQALTPFNRNNHLGSPPLSSSQLVSSSSSGLSSPVFGNAAIGGGQQPEINSNSGTGEGTASIGSGYTQNNRIPQSYTPNRTHSALNFDSQQGLNPWGLSNLVISESEENNNLFGGVKTEQKDLYQPFQQYQQSPIFSSQNT